MLSRLWKSAEKNSEHKKPIVQSEPLTTQEQVEQLYRDLNTRISSEEEVKKERSQITPDQRMEELEQESKELDAKKESVDLLQQGKDFVEALNDMIEYCEKAFDQKFKEGIPDWTTFNTFSSHVKKLGLYLVKISQFLSQLPNSDDLFDLSRQIHQFSVKIHHLNEFIEEDEIRLRQKDPFYYQALYTASNVATQSKNYASSLLLWVKEKTGKTPATNTKVEHKGP